MKSRPRSRRSGPREVTLAETLDRVLYKGAVIVGDLTISIADIDLLYVGLNVVLGSVGALKDGAAREPAALATSPAARLDPVAR